MTTEEPPIARLREIHSADKLDHLRTHRHYRVTDLSALFAAYDEQARKIAAALEINLSEKVRLALTTEGATP